MSLEDSFKDFVTRQGREVTRKTKTETGSVDKYGDPVITENTNTLQCFVDDGGFDDIQTPQGKFRHHLIIIDVSLDTVVNEGDVIVFEGLEYEVGPIHKGPSHQRFFAKRKVQ